MKHLIDLVCKQLWMQFVNKIGGNMMSGEEVYKMIQEISNTSDGELKEIFGTYELDDIFLTNSLSELYAAWHLKELRMKYNVGVGTILLSWCGLTIEEIINLKSEDVLKEENKVYIESKKNLISVDPAIMSILAQIKNGTSYAKIIKNPNKSNEKNDNILISEDFQYTEYFLKKKGKSSDCTSPISKNLINLSLSELNNSTENITFSLGMLRENGLLYRAYQRSKKIIDFLGKNIGDKEYYAIFDDCVKDFSKNKFNELKYKYRAFVKLIEKKEN